MERTALGRYRIVERLGAGGMGEVFLAEDPRLAREVALKVIRQDALRDEAARHRFRQEARTLSRLLHPNIATLFDYDSDGGVEFLVMERVPGQTLAQLLAAGPLPESRARAIAVGIAEALQAAHEQGVVHRDLKPGNVMITPRGRAKVLDFGLAAVLGDPSGPSHAPTASLPGSLVGTAAYLAPEQVSGGPLDARADLHALGAIVFEMVAGRPPFQADGIGALLYAIAERPAPALREARPGASAELEAIVARCLEKEPSRRFADAEALARALRGAAGDSETGIPRTDRAAQAPAPPESAPLAPARTAAGSPTGAIRSLAVLPFANRSGDPEQEFFADGMTDALITGLAQIGALRVISRTSAMRFKGSDRPLPEIAATLKVDAIVEGSAMRAGDRVRITVQLVEAATDSGLWAHSYERALTDILSLQDEVARAIAQEIRVQLTPEEGARLRSHRQVNPEAHIAYLRGRFLWNRWDTASLRQSLAEYQGALEIDPEYALAYAGLADSYNVLANTNAMPQREAYTRARQSAQAGLRLDSSLAELHASLAYVSRYLDWDWPAAERQFLHCLRLNPGYATGRRWYAHFLAGMGRHEEAIAEAGHALVLDPLSLINHTGVGDVYFYARRYDRSIAYYRRCLEMDPDFQAGLTDLSRALDQAGRVDEALAAYLRAVPSGPEGPAPSTGLATLYARAGRAADARRMMERLLLPGAREGAYVEHRYSPFGVATFHAVLGEIGPALDWLERGHAERDGTLVWIKVHPRLDGLRGEPRFRALLAAMRLED